MDKGVRARFLSSAIAFACAVASSPALASEASPESCRQHFENASAAGKKINETDAVKSVGYLDGTSLQTPEIFSAALLEFLSDPDESKPPSVIVIEGGNFDRWAFQNLSAQGLPICFYRSSLVASDWEHSDFPGTGFVESDLTNANFRSVRMTEVIFHDAILRNADMRRADLSRGKFGGGWGGSIENWNLSHAQMVSFTFDCGITVSDGCPLNRERVNFARANLKGADISSFLTWGDSDFDGAVFNSTKIAPQQVPFLGAIKLDGTMVLRGGNKLSYLTKSQFRQLQALANIAAEERSEPSFPCSQARILVEELICGEYEDRLRVLDRRMAFLYANAWPYFASKIQSQREWLEERNTCDNVLCVEKIYEDRISKVLAANGEPAILELGESAYFIPDTIGLPRSAAGSQLYERIVPAIAGEASASVRLTREFDGSYSIIGQAIGANAHVCSLSGKNLVFDKNSGWFSDMDQQGNRLPIFQLIGDEIAIFENGRPTDQRPQNASSIMSCGARASFPDMTRIFHSTGKLASLITFPDE